MCFQEATGKFLWQAVHDKLPDRNVKDWPKEGVCDFYRDAFVERKVCESSWGDAFPNYRDCLQREKKLGEGFVDRHASCLDEGHRRESALERREARANEDRSGRGKRDPKEPKDPSGGNSGGGKHEPKEPKDPSGCNREPKQPREGKN